MSAKPAKPATTVRPEKKPLPHWVPDLIGVLILYVAVVGLFREVVINHKVFSAGDDTVASLSWNTFAISEAEKGKYPLWCPEIYGGFPSFAAGAYSNYEHVEAPYSLAYRWTNVRYWADMFTNYVLMFGGDYSGANRGEKWLVALMLYAGLLIYYVIRRLGFGVAIALLGGLVLAWNPYYISLITASHGGKLATFVYIPLLMFLGWQLFDKRRLLDLAMFAMVFGWQIQHGGHTQVLFYSGVSVAILFVTWAIHELRAGRWTCALTAGGQLAAAVVLAVCVGSLWYIPLLEYVDYSKRGIGPAIGAVQSGYSLADATAWSMAPGELITLIFPSWYGLKSPTYWGDMLFTSSSFYFGIVPLLLAVVALIGKKTRLVWALLSLSVFSILLSFGKHFESFYAFFFNFVPFFNKFRTPSLILLLVMIAAAILTAFGIRKIEEQQQNEKWKKAFFYLMAGSAALLVLALVGGESLAKGIASLSGANDQRYQANQIAALVNERAAMLAGDLKWRMFLLLAASAMVYLFMLKKFSKQVLTLGLVLLTAIDLGAFAGNFFEPQPKAQQDGLLRTNRVVQQLQAEQGVFRVFPVGRLNQDNRWAAWGVESLGGYHGAMLRSWQDVAENLFYNGTNRAFPVNLELLSSLNCKYVIAEGLLPPDFGLTLAYEDGAAKMAAYRLPGAKERAYFVDSVLVIADRTNQFETMKRPGFPFTQVAVLDHALPGALGSDPEGTATVTKHEAHRVEIATRRNAAGLLVLADAHYAPGWQATVDGQKAEIFLVNGFVRGIYLPAGQHQVVFEYVGQRERLGVNVATFSHFLVLALVGAGFWLARRRTNGTA